MKASRVVFASLLVAGVLGSSIAGAQPPDKHGHGHEKKHGKRHGGPKPKAYKPTHGGPGHSAYAPGHWRKGDRLPPEYRDRQYVIDDWRGYHLAPPPRGYQWIGIGGDYLIVQIGSGVVLRVGP